MSSRFPSAAAYAAERARHPPLTPIDIGAEHAQVSEAYRNQVLADIDDHCLRLAVFEGEYRWHRHPDADELFLVVAGRLQIEFADAPTCTLGPWQALVVPAGTVHRTRGLGRTVNLTVERQGARTEFVEADGG